MGGTEKILIDIINNLPSSHYDITVFTLFDGGELNNKFRKGIKQISWLKHQYKGIYRLIKYFDPEKIYKKYLHDQYDIEISFKTGMPEKIVAASPNKKSKKIAWIHGDMEHHNFGFESHRTKTKQIACYSKFDDIVTVSEKCRNSFRNVVCDFENIHVMYNGIDIEMIEELAKQEVEITTASEELTFITVVRLHQDKGLDRLISAVDLLVKEGHHSFKILIVGDGSLKKELQMMVNERNLGKIIIFTGAKSNPYKYLAKSNVFILPSRNEPFGISIIEAMSLGLPIISTKCGGAEEIIGANEFGQLVENSVQGIYQGMKQALTTYSIKKDIYTQKSIERSQDFTINKMVAKMEEALLSKC